MYRTGLLAVRFGLFTLSFKGPSRLAKPRFAVLCLLRCLYLGCCYGDAGHLANGQTVKNCAILNTGSAIYTQSLGFSKCAFSSILTWLTT
jgi:hypothetical protein